MRNKKIAIVGADGKMGRLICQRLKVCYSIIKITKKLKLKKNKNISLVIDFASAESSVESAIWCKNMNVPLIIGSTGQTEEQINKIEECGRFVPILKSSNFSIGIQTIFKVLKSFCKNSPNEVTIFETHNKSKKDCPSGTAKEICNVIEKNTESKIQVLSERSGGGFGTHLIKFYFDNEIVEIRHTANSREVFVDGLEKCIEPMIEMKKAQLYGYKDILC